MISQRFSEIVCALLLMCGGARAHVMRYYNYVNVTDLQTTAELYQFFSNSAPHQSVLLGVASMPQCGQLMHNPFFRAAHRGSPAEFVNIATLPADQFPIPLNGCAELLWYPVNRSAEEPSSRTTDFERRGLSRWLHEIFSTNVRIVNDFSFPIEFFYEKESDDRGIFQGTIQPGSAMILTTHYGHVFSARTLASRDTAGRVLPAHTVDFLIVSGADTHRLSASNYLGGEEKCVGADVDTTFTGICQNIELIKYEQTFSSWRRTRYALNFLQPQVVRAVTSDGFKKMRVPAETFSWLRSWYDNEKVVRGSSVETRAGPTLNQRDAPSRVLHLDPHLKKRMADELQPIMQQWYSEPAELSVTSIYGIRTYVNGSVLAMHVDTLSTHVVSAIINIDQDVDEPWMLKILDHSNAEVDIGMAPGDMVLYESAKLLHGRPVPMNGRRYENIFIHYKPISGWDEYDHF